MSTRRAEDRWKDMALSCFRARMRPTGSKWPANHSKAWMSTEPGRSEKMEEGGLTPGGFRFLCYHAAVTRNSLCAAWIVAALAPLGCEEELRRPEIKSAAGAARHPRLHPDLDRHPAGRPPRLLRLSAPHQPLPRLAGAAGDAVRGGVLPVPQHPGLAHVDADRPLPARARGVSAQFGALPQSGDAARGLPARRLPHRRLHRGGLRERALRLPPGLRRVRQPRPRRGGRAAGGEDLPPRHHLSEGAGAERPLLPVPPYLCRPRALRRAAAVSGPVLERAAARRRHPAHGPGAHPLEHDGGPAAAAGDRSSRRRSTTPASARPTTC